MSSMQSPQPQNTLTAPQALHAFGSPIHNVLKPLSDSGDLDDILFDDDPVGDTNDNGDELVRQHTTHYPVLSEMEENGELDPFPVMPATETSHNVDLGEMEDVPSAALSPSPPPKVASGPLPPLPPPPPLPPAKSAIPVHDVLTSSGANPPHMAGKTPSSARPPAGAGRASCSTAPAQQKTKWDEMFQRLLDFRAKEGHCRVPNRYKADKALGNWVSTQRREYKKLKSGGASTTGSFGDNDGSSSKSSPMTEERIRRLESVGFEWTTRDPPELPWNRKYHELLQYKRKYGDCLVPIGYKDNVQLGNWVSRQRQEYKKLRDGQQSRLTKEQIKKLDDIGFVWVAQRGGPKKPRTSKGDRPSPKNSYQSHPQRWPVPTHIDFAPSVPSSPLGSYGGGPIPPSTVPSPLGPGVMGPVPPPVASSAAASMGPFPQPGTLTTLQTRSNAVNSLSDILKKLTGVRFAGGGDGSSNIPLDVHPNARSIPSSLSSGGAPDGAQIIRSNGTSIQASPQPQSPAQRQPNPDTPPINVSELDPDILKLCVLLSKGAVIQARGGSLFSVKPLPVQQGAASSLPAASQLSSSSSSFIQNNLDLLQHTNIEELSSDFGSVSSSSDDETEDEMMVFRGGGGGARHGSTTIASAEGSIADQEDSIDVNGVNVRVSELDPDILKLCILLSKGAKIQAEGDSLFSLTPLGSGDASGGGGSDGVSGTHGQTSGSVQSLDQSHRDMPPSSLRIEEVGDDGKSIITGGMLNGSINNGTVANNNDKTNFAVAPQLPFTNNWRQQPLFHGVNGTSGMEQSSSFRIEEVPDSDSGDGEESTRDMEEESVSNETMVATALQQQQQQQLKPAGLPHPGHTIVMENSPNQINTALPHPLPQALPQPTGGAPLQSEGEVAAYSGAGTIVPPPFPPPTEDDDIDLVLDAEDFDDPDFREVFNLLAKEE